MICPICANNKFISLKNERISETNNYLCLKCGLAFIPRTKNKIGQYYKNNGYFKKSPNVSLKEQFISKNLLIHLGKKRVLDIKNLGKIDFFKKSVLDIGCAYGELLYVLKKEYRSKVMGIEASGQVAKAGNQMFEVEIKPILLEELKTNKKFDIILCCHTLEHVSDPSRFLHLIKKFMKNDSILYLEVPNIQKPTGDFNLKTFFYNEHIQTFSSYNLSLLLNKNQLYIRDFSDKGFLKFISTKESAQNLKPKIIKSISTLHFLRKYKKNYNLISELKVLSNKLQYLLKLLIFKIIDLVL